MFNLDASDAHNNLQRTINALELYNRGISDRLRVVATASADEVQQRIQQRGENAQGERMQTTSPTSRGAYSDDYGREREKAGLQTRIIDLTYSGRLFDSWGAYPDGDDYGVGFDDYTINERAGFLEEKLGDIFTLSPAEADDAIGRMGQLNQIALNEL